MAKPPIKRLWHRPKEFEPKRRCAACGKVPGQVKELNWAHTVGRGHDEILFIGDWQDPQTGETMFCQLAEVHEDDVLVLCGPATETGTCHNLYDTHRLDIWDLLSEAKKERAKLNAGGLGQALHRCAPLTWLDRVEMVDGRQVEVQI